MSIKIKFKFPLILGSQSSSRLEILHKMAIFPDQQIAAKINEVSHKKELPRIFAQRMAKEKIDYLLQKIDKKENLVLTFDTVAACGRRILQKPKDLAQAEFFLHLLAGRRHKVLTSVCFSHPNAEKIICKIAITILKFKRLQKSEIKMYLNSQEWQGKAGGYGIQGFASNFIEWSSGREDAVVGLPSCIVYKLLLPFVIF